MDFLTDAQALVATTTASLKVALIAFAVGLYPLLIVLRILKNALVAVFRHVGGWFSSWTK